MVIEGIDVGCCACEMLFAAVIVLDHDRIAEPILTFIIHNESCLIHTGQWRLNYLGLPAGLSH